MSLTTDLHTLFTGFMPGPRIASRVPETWTDAAYTRITVEPLSPTIGGVISGVSLADPVDAELLTELNRALLEWKVLFFRNQQITGEQQVAFARNWGQLEAHPFIKIATDQPDETPEVVRFEKGPEMGGFENVWHSDVTWREIPSLGSILRAVEVPPVGGDTLFADMGAAYDKLPESVKERIEGLTAVHDWVVTFGMAMDAKTRDELRVDFPPAEHPVVRTHPETGRKTLYVPRVPVPLPVAAGRRGVLGQPVDAALRDLRLLPPAPGDGAHHRHRRPPVLSSHT
jgi:taurine dioxygenase